MNHERISNQRHLLQCYLLLHDFRVESSLETGPLRLKRRADDRNFYLKVDSEWLALRSSATTQSRLDALRLIEFLEANGSARVGLTATGQEVVTPLEPEGGSSR